MIITLLASVFIGTQGLGHVTPAATTPFGLVQAGPDTSGKAERFVADWAHTCGYQYTDTWVWRFSQTHLQGTGCSSFGDIGLLPYNGGFDGRNQPAQLLKETETAQPGHYAVTIHEADETVACRVVARPHVALYRFTFSQARDARLLLDLDWGIGNPGNGGCWGKYVTSCVSTNLSPTVWRGVRTVTNWARYRTAFDIRFSRPIVKAEKLRGADGVRGEVYELSFGDLPEGVLELAVALSSTTAEQAAANGLAEAPTIDFAAAEQATAALWQASLGRVTLGEETDPAIRESFEAALYRTMIQPNNLADVGGEPFYSTLSLWDTFRAAHPLYTILAPERVNDFVRTMLRQYRQQGYLPIWALGGDENHCMIAKHAVPVIVDAYLKGFRDYDVDLAWEAVRASLRVNHHAVNDMTWGLMKEDYDVLDRYGYIPFDKMSGWYGEKKVIGEATSRTLEVAYDDACAARFATALGHDEDAAFFARRSGAWKNVFDAQAGFMRGKDSKGNWREPFDPIAIGGGPWTDNDFCEGNAWQYTWHVMQDPEGLIAALGGREKFLAKLEQLFTMAPVEYKDRPTGDVSGLIGQYAHGNEPSHHTIYFFTKAGRPDLAAKYVREVFETQYAPTPDGLCGNDDCGQMAAWYVFSALGFYPFDPCGGEYVLGAPQVPRATIHLPQGKTFTIVAQNLSKKNLSVRRVCLNGQPLESFVLRHEQILAGGELVFEMAESPR